jgi:putative transposase
MGISVLFRLYYMESICIIPRMSKYSIQYKSNNNVIYSCKYYVIWCPKYRRSVLANGIDTRLEEIIHTV